MIQAVDTGTIIVEVATFEGILDECILNIKGKEGSLILVDTKVTLLHKFMITYFAESLSQHIASHLAQNAKQP